MRKKTPCDKSGMQNKPLALASNPAKAVEPPKVMRKQVTALEREDVMKIFALLKNEPLQYHIFIKLAILSGMRRGELIGLKWSNIDFAKCIIHIVFTLLYTPKEGIFEDTTKTQDSVRTNKLSAHIFQLLKDHSLLTLYFPSAISIPIGIPLVSLGTTLSRIATLGGKM